VSIPKDAARRFGLPFMTDLLDSSEGTPKALVCGKTAYGDKPAFSLAVNHRKVYTGITDNDRSLTIKAIDAMISGNEKTAVDFIKGFYSPGHVFLLIGRGLGNRKGHTELSLELAGRSGLGAMVLCEMLGKGKALPKKDAQGYAKRHGLVFLEGKEIIESKPVPGRTRM
jgi:3,4-dihydroxy 2-butanone 4-phosphate synthase